MRKFGEIILVKVSLRGAIFGKISSVDYSRKNNSVHTSEFFDNCVSKKAGFYFLSMILLRHRLKRKTISVAN